MIKIKGMILEISELGEYQGSPYASIKFRSDEVGKGQILKYKLDLKQVDYPAIAKLRDKQVTLDVDIVKGQSELASLKCVGFSDKVS